MGFSIFKSKEDKERRAAEYRKKMLPFGERQADLERELVVACFDKPERYDITELYFQLLAAKDILLDPVETEKDLKRKKNAFTKWYTGRLQKQFSADERCRVCALAELIIEAGSLEDFPKPEEIGPRAELFKEETLPGLLN